MKTHCSIILLLMLLMLTGCASRRQTRPATPEKGWHTCSVQANATASMGSQSVQAQCYLQAVRDSMLVVSVQALPGLEIGRLEATPDEVLLIDRMNRQYCRADYATLSRVSGRDVRWQSLQMKLTQVPDTGEPVVINATFRGQAVMLRLDNMQAQWDEAVQLRRATLNRYTSMQLPELL